jgi:nucleotide-binding universal stress UspA family protein
MKTILCPIDFSPASENALLYADQLATWLSASLVLLHNISEPVASKVKSIGGVYYDEPIRDPDHRQQLLSRLASWANKLPGNQGSKPVRYQSRIRYGLTQENIVEEAITSHSDLIVLGRKQSQGLKQWLSGSVVGDVVRQAPCPVLIIPHDAGFQPWSRIIFATNLSEEDAPELDFLVQAAAIFRAKVLFLHILPDYPPFDRQEVEKQFERFRKKFPSGQAELYIQTQEDIDEGIQQFTWLHPADLLVTGSHPHNWWESFILGDHTKQMAFHAKLPVMILHF